MQTQMVGIVFPAVQIVGAILLHIDAWRLVLNQMILVSQGSQLCCPPSTTYLFYNDVQHESSLRDTSSQNRKSLSPHKLLSPSQYIDEKGSQVRLAMGIT